MNCLTAQKILMQLDAGIVSQQDAIPAKEHLLLCQDCRKILEQEQSFRKMVRDRIREPAPNSLREKILTALAAKRELREKPAKKKRVHPFDLQTADVGMLEGWFAERVDFAVRMPRLRDTTLLGGHLCIIAGKRTVSLMLSKGDIPISLYIIDRNIMDLSSLKQVAGRGSRHFYKGDGKGCNLILWEERGLIYGVVSDMTEKDLIGLLTQS